MTAWLAVLDPAAVDDTLTAILFTSVSAIVVASVTATATVAVALITSRQGAKVDDIGSKVDQVHTLVNSNMTTALENELEARRSSLVLLLAALGDRTPSTEVEKAIGSAEDRIKLLEAQLIARYAADTAAQEDRDSGKVKPVEVTTPDAVAADVVKPDTKVP